MKHPNVRKFTVKAALDARARILDLEADLSATAQALGSIVGELTPGELDTYAKLTVPLIGVKDQKEMDKARRDAYRTIQAIAPAMGHDLAPSRRRPYGLAIRCRRCGREARIVELWLAARMVAIGGQVFDAICEDEKENDRKQECNGK